MSSRTALVASSVLLAMMPCVVQALPHLLRHGTHVPQTVKMGDWQLDWAHDPFSQEVACRLRAHDGKAIYRAGAVGFRFDPHWDVAGAVYRLDGGEPRWSRDDLPDLVARRVPIDRGGMDNPAGGIVWVPYERLLGANRIAIEPQPGRHTVTFHFRGLVALHDIALERGCTPESRFVEQ